MWSCLNGPDWIAAPSRTRAAGWSTALPNYPLDAVLSKAPDVITYVEHGTCDLGIVGKDIL